MNILYICLDSCHTQSECWEQLAGAKQTMEDVIWQCWVQEEGGKNLDQNVRSFIKLHVSLVYLYFWKDFLIVLLKMCTEVKMELTTTHFPLKLQKSLKRVNNQQLFICVNISIKPGEDGRVVCAPQWWWVCGCSRGCSRCLLGDYRWFCFVSPRFTSLCLIKAAVFPFFITTHVWMLHP